MTEEKENTEAEWFIFDSYREMKVLNDGKLLVVRPFDKIVAVPLFCPLCAFPMRTADDSVAYRKTRTCHKCNLKWDSEPENVDKTTEQFKDYLTERELLGRPLLIIK